MAKSIIERMPACPTCRHLDIMGSRGKAEPVCKAFPAGIPMEIQGGDHQHREPFSGDHGIRWQPLPGMEIFDVPEIFEDEPQQG